ncbi:sugar phosphate nucleotidyltransferase [Candidatus Tisiphia endosymbiont of Parasteatoda lunata]|uniref:sugar phosphate nucleotidyltransferase n=1 Tax=Candidatus Tisiphia endosymbiont of Parasteatoda lunata TaxID=3066275 RepID=UPI00313D6B31
MKVKPVIMAGGLGTRLWPLSRQMQPKQFIKIFKNLSLIQKTLITNRTLGKPTLIIAKEYELIAKEQLRGFCRIYKSYYIKIVKTKVLDIMMPLT